MEELTILASLEIGFSGFVFLTIVLLSSFAVEKKVSPDEFVLATLFVLCPEVLLSLGGIRVLTLVKIWMTSRRLLVNEAGCYEDRSFNTYFFLHTLTLYILHLCFKNMNAWFHRSGVGSWELDCVRDPNHSTTRIPKLLCTDYYYMLQLKFGTSLNFFPGVRFG
jgi:hypothetical protein